MSFDNLASGWAKIFGIDRKQFNMFFERMMDGFAYHKIIVDSAGKPVDYLFLEVNSAFERLTGLKRENVVGKRVTEALPGIEKDAADWIGVYGKVALTGEPTQFENYAKPLGRWYRVNVYCPTKGYFVSLFEDITDRKKAEQGLRESDERFRLALQNAPVSVAAQDLDLRYIWAYNQRTARPDQILGKLDSEIFTAEEATHLGVVKRRVINEGIELREQLWFNRPSGRIFLDVTWAPLRDEQGKIAGVTSATVDLTAMKLAEAKVAEQAFMIENVNDAIIGYSYDQKVIFWNKAAEKLYGYTSEEVLGKFGFDLLKPQYTNVTRQELIDKIARQGHNESESIRYTKGGGSVSVEARVVLLRDEACNPIGYVSVDRDITQRKKAEDSIRALNERFEMAQRAAGVGVWDWDVKTGRIDWSSEMFRLFGLDPKTVSASFETWGSVLHPEDKEKADAKINEALKTHSFLDNEYRVVKPNGEMVWINALGHGEYDNRSEPFRMTGICIDITARKKAQEALKQSEERFRLVIENSRDGINLFDLKTGKYVFMSPAQVALTGFTAEEINSISAKEAYERTHPDDREITMNQQKRVASGEDVPEPVEYRWKVKSGEYRWFSDSRRLVHDEIGQPIAMVGVSRDITERKKEEEVHSKQAALIDLSPDAIIVRKLNGTITFWSHGAETLYGWSKEEAIDRTTHSLLKTEFPMPLNEIMVQVSSRGYWSGELTHKTKDGRRLCVRSHWLGRFDKNKENLLEILETNVDITEQKQMRDKLEEYAKNLESLVEERTQEVTTERERLYQVLETIPAYVVLLDKDYRVPFANRVFRDLFGESNGRCCYDFLFHRNSPCDLCETFKVLQTGKPHRWEWTGPNGHNYDIYDFPFKVSEGSLQILEMGVDITERKKAEAAVQTERKRLFSVLETMPQMICLLTPDYHVAFANRAFREKFGESHGKHCYEYCYGKKKPCAFCESYEALKTGKPHHWEVTTEEGSIIDVHDFPFTDEDGSPLILEIDTDITEQRRAENKIRDASLYSRSLLEASLDPLVTISADGKITDVNKAAQQATGCSLSELIGSDFSDYFTQPAKAREGYKKVFTNGFVIDYPLTLKHKSGRLRDVLYNASVYRNEKGEIQGVFAAARDVTELNRYRQHLEELVTERTAALNESQLKLEQKAAEVEEYATNMEALAEERARRLKDAERLAAIGATAGMVGHDIRNPLQAITGDVYLARCDVTAMRPGELKASLTESLESIQKSVDYVNKIVQDLQDFAKPLRPTICETDLQAIIDEIVKKNGIPPNIAFTQHLTTATRTIKTDSDMLKRILGNLIGNAVQAMPDGGKLSLKATKTKGFLILTVKDTGLGIPEGTKANLFTPLFTTKSKGQGFGLAVVKRMTEALGGTVSFKSEEGKGAEFVVTLPQ